MYQMLLFTWAVAAFFVTLSICHLHCRVDSACFPTSDGCWTSLYG